MFQACATGLLKQIKYTFRPSPNKINFIWYYENADFWIIPK